MFDAFGPRNVGDVNQAVDALFDLDEGAEIGQIADASLDTRTDAVSLRESFPGVWLDLFDPEADAAAARIDFEDGRFDFLSNREQFRWVLDAFGPAHLRNVNQALDSRFEFAERAVICQADDLTLDARADREPFHGRRPRIRDQLFIAQTDALFVAIEFEHFDLDALADLENLVRILNPAPGHIRDMEQTIEPAKIDECAIFGNILDLSFDDDSFFEMFERLVLFAADHLFEHRLA